MKQSNMPESKNPQISSLRLLILSPTSSSQESEDSASKVTQNASNAHFVSFLTNLTGTAPSKDLTSFAGYTSHPPLSISTKYYATKVNLWCDELPATSTSNDQLDKSSLSEWTSQMLSSEAQEVREVIGGIVILSSFNAASVDQKREAQNIMNYATAVNQVREAIEDEFGRDVATILAVQDMTPSAAAERQSMQGHGGDVTSFAQKLEESCLDEHGIFGWNIVAWRDGTSAPSKGGEQQSTEALHDHEPGPGTVLADTKRNEFGEKLGMPRILEVLEQVNWSVSSSSLDEDDDNDYDPLATDDFLDNDDSFDTPSFKPNIKSSASLSKDPILQQSDEFQREIMGLHFALEEQSGQEPVLNGQDGNDIQVEKLSSLMEKVMAIKEAGSEMSKVERERFAKREVGRIMREMDFGE